MKDALFVNELYSECLLRSVHTFKALLKVVVKSFLYAHKRRYTVRMLLAPHA